MASTSEGVADEGGQQEVALTPEFMKLVEQSKTQDVADIAQAGVAYCAGTSTTSGLPVMVFYPGALTKMGASDVLLERILLYGIRVLDKIAGEPYELVYCHLNANMNKR